MPDFNIVFMGTPEFAIPSLEALLKKGYNVKGVVTAPDKPKGRGMQLCYSPVKMFALKYGLNILQPSNLKDINFQNELRNLKSDLQIVVAFRMLPEVIWSMPDHGTINLHASLLPDYRGAAPINWALINGESLTGLTTFFIDKEIDTGRIILQDHEPIRMEDDAGKLHDRLKMKGADLVLRTVDLILNKKVTAVAQPMNISVKKAPKITKEMCKIDFEKTAEEINNLIRGLSPSPGAVTSIGSKMIKIFRAQQEEGDMPLSPGEYVCDNKTYLKFKTGKGMLGIMEFQVEGKKRMSTEEYFRGNRL